MSSVPFFKNFTKRFTGYFHESKEKNELYDLQQRIQFQGSCCDTDIAVQLNNKTAKTKLELKMKKEFGELKITEVIPGDSNLKVDVNIPKFYKNIDWISKHSRSKLEVELQYKPDSYFNVTLKGICENDDGKRAEEEIALIEDARYGSTRMCSSTLSFACGDDSLHLNVGGEITVVDQPRNGGGVIQDYKLGFLYEPSDSSSYAVIYSPDKISNGLDFEFSCFKQSSENVSVVGRVVGKVDIQKSAINPVISIAGGYTFGENKSNYLQAFVSSNKEYGISYATQLSNAARLTLGVANYLEKGHGLVSRFGYKLELN